MHSIRESHLKRAAFGIVTANGALVVNGKLYRAASLSEAEAEARRRTLALQGAHFAARLDSMPDVRIYGLGFVLASSGTR